MKRFLLSSLTVLLVTASFARAQQLPVTTASDAARQHYVQGVSALANADFARARTHLDAALDADPSFAMAHMYRAVAAAEGREDHARQATSHGTRASEAERQMIASYAAHLDGDHEREIALMNTVAEAFPSDPYPPFQVGFELYGMERYDEAVAAFQRAIAADPSFGGSYNGLGYAAMEAGNNTLAEKAFRDYIRVAPDEANPYDSYGEFLMN
jgi:Tfp pilus assembly protein PilF